jgi:hypothetical protein
MAAPPGRVFTVAQSLRLGRIKHALDPTAKAGGVSDLSLQSGFKTKSTSSVVIL